MAGLLIFFIGFLGAGGCLPERCGVGVFLAQFTIIIIIIARAMAATTARAVPLLHFVTLHHALRRMAGLVFLFCFLEGAGGRLPKARRGNFFSAIHHQPSFQFRVPCASGGEGHARAVYTTRSPPVVVQ